LRRDRICFQPIISANMPDITCFHCARSYDSHLKACPHCGAPAEPPEQKMRRDKTQRFIWLFIALVVFCAIMIVWLPRFIPPQWRG